MSNNINGSDKIVCKSNGALSQENLDKLYEVGNYVKKLKEKHNETNEQMETFLNENSVDERKELEAALSKFNKKMESLVKSKSYKDMEEKLEKYEEKLQVTMTQVMINYKKAIKQIHRTYENKEDREQKMIAFHKVIEDAFLDKDEKLILNTIKSEIKALPRKVIHL